MGTDDLFKKRREQRKQRKREFKTPKANSFLNAMEEGKQFIYSAIPLKYTQYELVDILRRNISSWVL